MRLAIAFVLTATLLAGANFNDVKYMSPREGEKAKAVDESLAVAVEPPAPPQETADVKMYAGSKVYIHPMDGFENYFAAAMMNKKVALAQTTKPEDADYHINIAAEEQKAGWAKMIFRGSAQSAVDMSVMITNPETGTVLWTCSVSKGNAIRGKRSAAEACAKNINKFLHVRADK